MIKSNLTRQERRNQQYEKDEIKATKKDVIYEMKNTKQITKIKEFHQIYIGIYKRKERKEKYPEEEDTDVEWEDYAGAEEAASVNNSTELTTEIIGRS